MNEFDQTTQLMAATTAVSTITSIPFTLNGLTRYSVQVDFSSGSCTGSFTLQYSNNGTIYIPDPDSTIVVTAGGSHLVNVANAHYKYVQVVWTPTSGVGTITMTMEVKGVQG